MRSVDTARARGKQKPEQGSAYKHYRSTYPDNPHETFAPLFAFWYFFVHIIGFYTCKSNTEKMEI